MADLQQERCIGIQVPVIDLQVPVIDLQKLGDAEKDEEEYKKLRETCKECAQLDSSPHQRFLIPIILSLFLLLYIFLVTCLL